MGNGELIPVALAYAAAGLSVIPVKADKTPLIKWEPLQERILTTPEIQEHWKNGAMLAIGCGPISGNLEVMDFDCPERDGVAEAWDDFKKIVADHGETELWEKLLRIQTPSGGWHLCYRHNGAPQRNLKLAYNIDNKITIETRGDGGYVMTAPSAGYRVSHGDWLSLPTLTEDEHEFLLNAARFLDEGQTKRIEHPRGVAAITRPGDAFNLNGEDCATQLMNAGWKPCKGKSGGLGGNLFTRPGKEHGPSASVTTNGSLVYVYTSNAYPLEAGKAYTRFTLYAALNFKGDFSMAARDLASKGFGASNIQQQTNQERIYVTNETENDGPKPLSSFTVTPPKWLMEGWEYIRREHVNLLEAKGYTGKSTLCLAIAGLGSVGRTPFYEACEPIKTLYCAREDDGGDLRFRIEKVLKEEANIDKIEAWDRCPILDYRGVEKLGNLIADRNYDWVILDPLKSLFPVGLSDIDNVGLNRFFDSLRQIAIDTGCAITAIRHFPKVQEGRTLPELATGGSQWRDSARTQLVMLPHPDHDSHRTYVGLFPCRGSMNATPGDPFGFVPFKTGGCRFDIPDAFALDTFAEGYKCVAEHYSIETEEHTPKHKGGRPNNKKVACVQWLAAQMESGPCFQTQLMKNGADAGFAKGTIYSALATGAFVQVSESPLTWRRS